MTVLRQGNEGSAVSELKADLRMLGYDVPEGDVYCARTRAAVMQFQESCGLDVDGICGKDTFGALDSRIHAAEAARSYGIDRGSLTPYTPPAPVATRVSYDSGERIAGFGGATPNGIDVARLSPEIRERANERGWIMALVGEEAGKSASTGRDQYRGGLYFINVNTREVREYAAVGGGKVDGETNRNGPTPGVTRDLYHGDADGSINAIYGGISVPIWHRYGTVVRLDGDPLDNRSGILIHRLFNNNTSGCIGIERDEMREVADNVKNMGIREMVVLNPEHMYQPQPQRLQYAQADPYPESGHRSSPPPADPLATLRLLSGR